MKRNAPHLLWAPLLALFLALPALAANTPGTFRGVMVEPPQGDTASTTMIYLQSKNGSIRKVESSKAEVAYDEGVPEAERAKTPREGLKTGMLLRVTAQQENDGEWHATKIEILGDSNRVNASSDDDDDGLVIDTNSNKPVIRKS